MNAHKAQTLHYGSDMNKLVLLLIFLSSMTSASQFNKGENLITPYQPSEDNWEVLKKNKPQERAMMWADKKLGFSDSYTITVYPNSKTSLKHVRKIQDAPGRKACKLFESIDLPALKNKNYESIFWRTIGDLRDTVYKTGSKGCKKNKMIKVIRPWTYYA